MTNQYQHKMTTNLMIERIRVGGNRVARWFDDSRTRNFFRQQPNGSIWSYSFEPIQSKITGWWKGEGSCKLYEPEEGSPERNGY